MRINRKFFILGVVLGTLLWASFWGARGFLQSRQSAYKTAVVEKGTLTKTISASGKIKALDEVKLQFPISGRLAWVGVKEGDRVVTGQALAQLDQRELQKNLEKTLRDYLQARNDFEETYQVTYPQQTPQTALTDAIKRILEKNQWNLEKAVLDVELRDLALAHSLLTTPLSGVVTHAEVSVGGVNIMAGNNLFTIANPNSIVFLANVDEADIAEIREGQEASFVLDAYLEEEITGRVGRIAFSSITTSGGGTAFPVEITLPKNTEERFKIGMNGDVEIIASKRENALFVPGEAIIAREGKKFLKILAAGKPQEVEVQIGLTTERETEILGGVQEGEIVIISTEK